MSSCSLWGVHTGNYYGLVDCSLFLPESWATDAKRCEKAGVPKENIIHKSKPKLALEMVKGQVALGNKIDFVACDGLYGNDYSLMDGLDDLGLIGVLDVHSDQYVFLEEPIIAVPENKGSIGRKATKYKTISKAIEVRALKKQLEEQGREAIEDIVIRQGTKGGIKNRVAIITVYVWDGKSDVSKQRQLLIRISKTATGGGEIKYAL